MVKRDGGIILVSHLVVVIQDVFQLQFLVPATTPILLRRFDDLLVHFVPQRRHCRPRFAETGHAAYKHLANTLTDRKSKGKRIRKRRKKERSNLLLQFVHRSFITASDLIRYSFAFVLNPCADTSCSSRALCVQQHKYA